MVTCARIAFVVVVVRLRLPSPITLSLRVFMTERLLLSLVFRPDERSELSVVVVFATRLSLWLRLSVVLVVLIRLSLRFTALVLLLSRVVLRAVEAPLALALPPEPLADEPSVLLLRLMRLELSEFRPDELSALRFVVVVLRPDELSALRVVVFRPDELSELRPDELSVVVTGLLLLLLLVGRDELSVVVLVVVFVVAALVLLLLSTSVRPTDTSRAVRVDDVPPTFALELPMLSPEPAELGWA